MKTIVYQSEAKAELRAAALYYDQQRPRLGKRFLAAVSRTIKRIRQNPQLGSPHNSSDVRFQLVRGFPYIIYYQEATNRILIVAVAHSMRRQGYWIRRLSGN